VTLDGILRLKIERPSLEILCEYNLFSANRYNISRQLRTAGLFQPLAFEIATLYSLHYEFAKATLSVSLLNEVPALRGVSVDD
jgi:hypothetical protein